MTVQALTPDDAAERLIAILRRNLPINDPQIGAASKRIAAGEGWAPVQRLRHVRAIVIDVGMQDGALPVLCWELRKLQTDITHHLDAIGGGS